MSTPPIAPSAPLPRELRDILAEADSYVGGDPLELRLVAACCALMLKVERLEKRVVHLEAVVKEPAPAINPANDPLDL